jgi:hypothetical protein
MRLASAGVLAVASLAALGAAGCTRTFRAEAVQPNPIAQPIETLRSSEKITIVTGDMELEQPYGAAPDKQASAAVNHRYPLYHQASFTIVSRDRLRFHVQLDHKWEEWADPTTWEVQLEDDAGHVWAPTAVEGGRTRLMSSFWDREQRSAICSSAGYSPSGGCIATVGLADDGWKHRQTFGTLSVFRGNADFVFFQPDLMHAEVRQLRLVVRRSGMAFEFNWRFSDAIAAQ